MGLKASPSMTLIVAEVDIIMLLSISLHRLSEITPRLAIGIPP
jgi:hypothetical protein